MYQKPILVPNDNTRRIYLIRGTVEGYGDRVSAWWIFRKRTPIIYIRINERQLVAFNKIAREEMAKVDRSHPGIAPVLKLGMAREDMKEFSIGAEVGITFGYAHSADQFFTGAEALKVMNLQLVKNGDRLKNEVKIE